MSSMRSTYIWTGIKEERYWVSGMDWTRWEVLPDLIQTRIAVLKTFPSEMFVLGIGRRAGYTYDVHCTEEEVAALRSAAPPFLPYWRVLADESV